MDNITFILPLHLLNDEAKEYAKKALKSIKDLKNAKKSKIIVAGPKEVTDELTSICTSLKMKNQITAVNDENTSYENLVNKSVLACTTKYFSIIEFDDFYNDFWINCAEKELNGPKNDISILMPINELYDTKENFYGFSNEIVWSSSFASKNELGFINSEVLEDITNFSLNGAIIKTEDYIKYGGLKESLKGFSTYELLLRFAYNSLKIYVVPKSGYIHTVNRDGSYINTINNSLSQEEIDGLYKKAKQEYFFKEDRG